MAMSYGDKPPENYNSELEGMAQDIYDTIDKFIVKPALEEIDKAVKLGLDKAEAEKSKQRIIYQNKLLAYAIAKGVIKHLKEKAKVTVDIKPLDIDLLTVKTNVTITDFWAMAGPYTVTKVGPAWGGGTGEGTGSWKTQEGTGKGIREGGAIE